MLPYDPMGSVHLITSVNINAALYTVAATDALKVYMTTIMLTCLTSPEVHADWSTNNRTSILTPIRF